MAVTHNAVCRRGHELDAGNILIDARGYPRCRECKIIRQRREREKKKQSTVDALAAEFGITVRPDASPEMRAWISRKVREKAGLPLREVDREQVTAQMEDL